MASTHVKERHGMVSHRDQSLAPSCSLSMSTISTYKITHQYLHKETKVACYADDIAIWHTDVNLEQSKRSLNCSLKGILEWSNSLKLKINPQKISYSIFSMDRKHRRLFTSHLVLNNQPLMKTDNPVYLGLTLDTELRFSEHIMKCANKSLKKLRILKSLCGTDWAAQTPKP